MTAETLDQRGQRILEEAMTALFPREPRVLLWPTADNGHVYGYTTERVAGYYVAIDWKPVGRGARTSPEQWKRARWSKRRKRKDAKALSHRWYLKAT
jgi:hypothetical protein